MSGSSIWTTFALSYDWSFQWQFLINLKTNVRQSMWPTEQLRVKSLFREKLLWKPLRWCLFKVISADPTNVPTGALLWSKVFIKLLLIDTESLNRKPTTKWSFWDPHLILQGSVKTRNLRASKLNENFFVVFCYYIKTIKAKFKILQK